MKKTKQFLTLLLGAILIVVSATTSAFADVDFGVSPPTERITLTPGETFYGTVTIVNPSTSESNFDYTVSVEPFYVNENNETIYDYSGSRTMMADWIHLDHETGVIEPNSDRSVKFVINVPEDAPAGGQYAAIMVSSNADTEASEGVNIVASYRFAHLIYADVAGESVHDGAITGANVPSFLFSGRIKGSATVENKGNTHAEVSHTLQIFPLFSNEEIYTNEEDPKTSLIMPGVKRSSSVSWEETPAIGVFHVVYNVEFEGAKSTVDKHVIVCPIWLLFLILIGIFLIIFRILNVKKKTEKK